MPVLWDQITPIDVDSKEGNPSMMRAWNLFGLGSFVAPKQIVWQKRLSHQQSIKKTDTHKHNMKKTLKGKSERHIEDSIQNVAKMNVKKSIRTHIHDTWNV